MGDYQKRKLKNAVDYANRISLFKLCVIYIKGRIALVLAGNDKIVAVSEVPDARNIK